MAAAATTALRSGQTGLLAQSLSLWVPHILEGLPPSFLSPPPVPGTGWDLQSHLRRVH